MAATNIWGMTMAPGASIQPQFRHGRSSCSCEISVKKSPNPSSSSSAWSSSLCRLQNRKHRKKPPNLMCRCSDSSSTMDTSSFSWDWNRWNRHFSAIDQAESTVSVLKFQLEDAIEKEDFREAVKLKLALEDATSMDTVAEIMSRLKSAIEEEHYRDALRLCKNTGSGLVGWWVGCSKTSNNPFGRLVQVTPGMGKFIGRSFTPRQLITRTPGTPLFEIYVIRDADGSYNMKVVYLQRAKKIPSGKPGILVSDATQGLSASRSSSAASVDIEDIEVKEDRAGKNEEAGLNIEGATEEGIRSVLKFLKDKIPGLKLKMNNGFARESTENSDSVKQLTQEDDQKQMSGEKSDEESADSDEVQSDTDASDAESNDFGDGKNLDMKLFIGGVVHNEDTLIKEEYVRLPAELKDMEKDSFVFHIPDRKHTNDSEESEISKLRMASIAAQGVSELMPPDVAKAFFTVDKISSKVSRDVREIIKLAVSQAQKWSELSDLTSFSRVTTGGNLDPFDGLYVGAFGPYGTEIVHLRRKFGYWNGLDGIESNSDVEFFEYVEAVKITGDLNVPAGQVTFRARIGRGNRNSSRGFYPDELGVVATYSGQGRMADFGFQNPRWVDGELLQLNGRGIGPPVRGVRGADLGFLFIVPEQSFLVLFSRLKLPE